MFLITIQVGSYHYPTKHTVIKMNQLLAKLPEHVQQRIELYSHPVLPRRLREDLHEQKLYTCPDCVYTPTIVGTQDDAYFSSECSCPQKGVVFVSHDIEEVRRERRQEHHENVKSSLSRLKLCSSTLLQLIQNEHDAFLHSVENAVQEQVGGADALGSSKEHVYQQCMDTYLNHLRTVMCSEEMQLDVAAHELEFDIGQVGLADCMNE